jgi:Dyp-type peroxidase family
MEKIEWHDVQGLVLSGYPTLSNSTYVPWCFTGSVEAAKKWLADLAEQLMRAGIEEDGPGGRMNSHTHDRQIKALKRDKDRACCAINLALTASGLEYLGLDEAALSSFSLEFLEGMSPLPNDARPVPRRSNVLGDIGHSSPEFWKWGGWDENRRIDGMLLLFAADDDCLQGLIKEETSRMKNAARPVTYLTGWVHGEHEPEHFGYVDGLSQPIIIGSPKAQESRRKHKGASPQNNGSRVYSPEEQRILFLKPGEFLLGYLNERNARVGEQGDTGTAFPRTRHGRDIRRNGTYLVFRHLEQDVRAFNDFLSAMAMALQVAGRPSRRVEGELAGKLLGRRRDGVPMVPCPKSASNPKDRNDFLYYFEDRFGISCPIGAHIRRANPRDSLGPDPDTALRLSKMHRIIRRGRPYGERDSDGERGMFFICLNADIAGQFELIQHSWLNNPHFAGLYSGIDPFSHVEDAKNSFVIQSRPTNVDIRRPRPFVKVRGGAYFFLPGIEAVRTLSK